MINAHRIIFNGLSSEEFDVIADLSFEGSDGTTSSFLNRDGVYTEHYDGRYRRIHSYKYNEVMTPRFTLIKRDCSDFTPEENRRILSWLTASDKPSWLEVYHDDSNVLAWQVFGNPISVEQYKMGSGRIVAYEFDFESNAPYAWSRKMEITKQISTPNPLTITCNSDEYNKLIYPKVIINFNGENIYFPTSNKPRDDDFMFSNVVYTFKEADNKGVLEDKHYVSIVTDDIQERAYVVTVSADSDLTKLPTTFPGIKYYHVVDGRDHTIRTIEDNQWKVITKTGAAVKIDTIYTFGGEIITKSVEIKNASLGEEITLDGINKVISVVWYNDDGDRIDDVRVIGDDFNWEWLPLAYGENNVIITGNCDVQIQWIEPRKVGSL